MKQLMVMRHAKSSWKDSSLSDHDRPLNPRGLRNAPEMGRYACQQACLPDLILSSTANRALTTARLFVEGAGSDIPIVTQKALYHPGVRDYCQAVGAQVSEQGRIMVVSHNPGSEEWIFRLTGSYETMPTGAIAVVEFAADFCWTKINARSQGELLDVWRPREIV